MTREKNETGVSTLRAAAIGIGSNSLRMLIADLENAQLHRVLRDREGLRVFAALDDNGDISEEMITRACTSVSAMATKARNIGAEKIHLFATSAVRDARNQLTFSERLLQSTGLPLEVCTGDTEAQLSFLGATGSERSGMIDIGGGSTEIVIGRGEKIDFAKSLQMGAVRLFRKMPIRNVEEAFAVVSRAGEILAPQKKEILSLMPPVEWVGVGGTFTTAAALAQNVHWNERSYITGFPLRRTEVERILTLLAPMPLEVRMALPGIQPQRADIIAHGMAILLCCMNELNISQMIVSESGNLEGYLKKTYL